MDTSTFQYGDERTGCVSHLAVVREALLDFARRFDRTIAALAVSSVVGVVPTILLSKGLDVVYVGAIGLGLGAIVGLISATLFCARAEFLRPIGLLVVEMLTVGVAVGVVVGLPVLTVASNVSDTVAYAWSAMFAGDWAGWKLIAVGSVLLGLCPALTIAWPARVLSEQSLWDCVLQVWATVENDGVYSPITITAILTSLIVVACWIPVICLFVPVFVGAFCGALFMAVRQAEK